MTRAAKGFAGTYYNDDGSSRTDTCAFCHERKPVKGDVLCERCRRTFDDGLDEETPYQKRIREENAMRNRTKKEPGP